MATIGEVLAMLIPTGGWIATGETFEGITFLTCAPITKAQFEQGVLDYPAWKTAQDQAPIDTRTSGITHALSLGFTQAQAEAMFP